MAQILKVNDLCKTYVVNKRQNNVLKNVSFEVEEGEMVAIMGPSGSGKSTLLYNVSGMDKATAGEIYLDGKKINDMSEKELSNVRLNELGFIFQQMYMVNNLNVFDNIILPAYQSERKDRTKAEINDYARELMKKLSISEIAGNDINEVSGGQLQRACICRSMINKPKVIFADEPTGALNRSSSDEVMKELNKINSEGTTIMIVTHDRHVAAKCSRIIYLVDGNIKGELQLGALENESEIRDRDRKDNMWLQDMGW